MGHVRDYVHVADLLIYLAAGREVAPILSVYETINLQVNASFIPRLACLIPLDAIFPAAASDCRLHDNETNRMALCATPKVGGLSKLGVRCRMSVNIAPPYPSSISC